MNVPVLRKEQKKLHTHSKSRDELLKYEFEHGWKQFRYFNISWMCLLFDHRQLNDLLELVAATLLTIIVKMVESHLIWSYKLQTNCFSVLFPATYWFFVCLITQTTRWNTSYFSSVRPLKESHGLCWFIIASKKIKSVCEHERGERRAGKRYRGLGSGSLKSEDKVLLGAICNPSCSARVRMGSSSSYKCMGWDGMAKQYHTSV